MIETLEEEQIEVEVFSAVTPNPKDHEIMAGHDAYRRAGCDILIALGGGSVIDCAKGISIIATNGGHILDFEGVDTIPVPGPPLICIPTTAGTAADISQFAIVSDSTRRTKIAIISKIVVPDIALVDPETTLTLDPYMTACTGLDALSHGIEAYVSTASSPVVDVHALAAIRGVRDNLLAAIAAPKDMVAREKMMLASLQAGLAFSNASLGAVHAMSHSLGGYLDIRTGKATPCCWSSSSTIIFSAAEDRFHDVGEALRLDMRGMTSAKKRKAVLEEIRALRTAAGIGDGLASRGVTGATIDQLSEFAIHDACIYTNPRRALSRRHQGHLWRSPLIPATLGMITATASSVSVKNRFIKAIIRPCGRISPT